MHIRIHVVLLAVGMMALTPQLAAQAPGAHSLNSERAITREIFPAPLASPTEPARGAGGATRWMVLSRAITVRPVLPSARNHRRRAAYPGTSARNPFAGDKTAVGAASGRPREGEALLYRKFSTSIRSLPA
jgi:hypothetical protein